MTRGASVVRERGTAWLWAIVVLAAALRFPTLGLQSLWADEAFTWDIAEASAGEVLGRVADTESTPPLHYVVTWLWTRVAGDSEAALRALPALWGTLTVPVVHATARHRFSERAGLAAAALVATAPLLVWYSQEARAYALLLLLSAVAVWALETGRLGAWSAASAAALATHYFAVFLVVPMAGWVLWRHRTLWPVVLPAVVGAALVPLLAHQQANVSRPWADAYTTADQVKATVQEFLVGHEWTWVVQRPALLVLAALWAVCGVWLWRGGGRAAILPLALAAIALVLPTLASIVGENSLAPRNVIGVWPLLAILVGAGAALHRRGPLVVGAACAVSVAIVVAGWSTPALQRDDWRGLLDPDPPAGTVHVVDDFNYPRVVSRYLDGARPASDTPAGVLTVVGVRAQGEERFTTAPVPGAVLVDARRDGVLRMSVWRIPAPATPAADTAVLRIP